MERNANYMIVGLFTIVCFIGLGAFIFWLGKYGVDQGKYYNYRTYVSESVSGLKHSSPVKLKGIDIGFVESVTIDADDPEKIEIRFKVEKQIPIKTDSIAVLNSQGIAGVGFLEIVGGTKNAPGLKPSATHEYIYIRSKPSLYARFTDKIDDVLETLQKTTTKVDRMASDKNIDNVGITLENMASVTTELKENRKEFSAMIRGARAVEDHSIRTMDHITGKMDESSDHIRKISEKTDGVLDETKVAMQESSALIKEMREANISGKIGSVLDNGNDVLHETKSLVTEGKALVQQLQESPSDLLFK